MINLNCILQQPLAVYKLISAGDFDLMI